MPTDLRLAPLRTLSARVGQDPLLPQANSGNTSMKLDGVLWIKASGKQLSDALHENIFLPLDLAEVRECVRQSCDPAGAVIGANRALLRPSVETAMHATLPHRVVIHLHSVNTIAYAVRRDAPDVLQPLLSGLAWHWIPYASSGLALARRIEHSLQHAPADVFILGNHGVIVCAEHARGAEALLADVESRLAAVPRRAPEFDEAFLRNLASGSAWRLPDQRRPHALATDPASREILSGGALYGSQVVVFGHYNPWASFYSGLYSQAVLDLHADTSRRFVIVRDKGILIRDTLSATELETLLGLLEVVQRVHPSAPIRYLTAAESEYVARCYMRREPPALYSALSA